MSKVHSKEVESRQQEHDVFRTERIGVLGEGSFGSVVLLKDNTTEKNYALKALSKEHITKENLGASVQNERTIMSMLDSDFIVRLYKTYQDRSYLFFMMEPVMGGELFDIYNDNDLFGKLPVVKFHIACVAIGLHHLHIKRVIYRDLKLENCLVSQHGYVKLADMGIAKIVIGKTYTICGTADYFAPETLRQQGHNRAADWWACGVLLFIMSTGWSPFDAPEVTQIYQNIMKGFSKVKFPEKTPSDLIDVVKSLCRKKPEERVAMQKGGIDNLKELPFFSGLDWDDLEATSVTPPFVPPELDDTAYEKFKKKKLTRDFEVNVDNIRIWDGSLPKTGEE